MDERLVRAMVLADAIQKRLEPLRPLMEQIERVRPLTEAINSNPHLFAFARSGGFPSPVSSVPVVTDYKPLRAPGYQAPERNGLATPLEHQAPQNTDTSHPNKAPGNAFPNYKNEKQRTNNLERAVEAAMKKLGRMATVDDLINFLAQSDETGFILRWDGEQIVWINSKGQEKKTGRRGIEIHRQKYR